MSAAERIAERIVDDLERKFWVSSAGSVLWNWDHDEARRIIAMSIPLDAAEAEEEFDQKLREAAIEPLKPGPASLALGRLRAALGGEGLSIVTVLQAAADRIEQLKAD